MKLIWLFFFSILSACGLTSTNQTLMLNQPVSKEATKYGYLFNQENPLGIAYEEKDGFGIVGGDILIPLKRISPSLEKTFGLEKSASLNVLWPNGRIPYQLPENFDYQDEWRHMLSEWKKAGIEWVVKTSDDAHWVSVELRVEKGVCGSSFLGRDTSLGSPQKLHLAPKGSNGNCNMRRTVLHESAHVLGFLHEHQRSDRDLFVKFPPETPVEHSSLKKYAGTVNLSPYDYGSITHYGTANSFGMISRDNKEIPLNTELSDMDIMAARMLYFPNTKSEQNIETKAVAAAVDSSPPEPNKPPEVAACLVKERNGYILSGPENTMKFECESKCALMSLDKDGVICKWNEELLTLATNLQQIP